MTDYMDTHALKAIAALQRAGKLIIVSSAYVGAKPLADRRRDLEAAAREENYTACIVLGYGLEELFNACCAELDAYMIKAA